VEHPDTNAKTDITLSGENLMSSKVDEINTCNLFAIAKTLLYGISVKVLPDTVPESKPRNGNRNHSRTGAARALETDIITPTKVVHHLHERRNADFVRRCIRGTPSSGVTQLYTSPIIFYSGFPVVMQKTVVRRSGF